MAGKKVIDIGNTDENADWIKSPPGHKDEVAIHDALAKKLKSKRKKKAKDEAGKGKGD